ncbi:hypothetical protein C8Q80DRAFT_1273171 [Daedaleopsis nitida]|nr:hypothetical protein C8Q80DRAFT_1273171 [Daedaleopsis nitida]
MSPDMSATAAAKESEVETSAPPSPQPDDEFWLEDGNLIIIACNIEFRVYKGPITANSPALESMLSLPQPEYGTPPDCICNLKPPVVHVSDSPEDFRHFLRALVPGKTPRIAPDEPSFHAVSACIRLGDKLFRHMGSPQPAAPPAFEAVHSIGVVNLARTINTPSLLPAALMACYMLDATELINGFTREDGTTEKLSQDDIGRCFLGRANLMQANTLATLELFAQKLSKRCIRRDVCAPLFLKLIDELRTHEDVVCTLDWFKCCMDYADARDEHRRICPACYKMLLDHEKSVHIDIWRRLPDLMGVPVEGWAAGIPDVDVDSETA